MIFDVRTTFEVALQTYTRLPLSIGTRGTSVTNDADAGYSGKKTTLVRDPMLKHEVEWPVKKVTFISQAETERPEHVAGAAMISITDPDKPSASLRLWEPLDRNTSRVVYELLCVPAKYEQLIQSHETQYLDEEIPFHVKIRELRR
ncbi:hypothetical protein ACNF43_23615 (plasmid) [Salmonella enterica]